MLSRSTHAPTYATATLSAQSPVSGIFPKHFLLIPMVFPSVNTSGHRVASGFSFSVITNEEKANIRDGAAWEGTHVTVYMLCRRKESLHEIINPSNRCIHRRSGRIKQRPICKFQNDINITCSLSVHRHRLNKADIWKFRNLECIVGDATFLKIHNLKLMRGILIRPENARARVKFAP